MRDIKNNLMPKGLTMFDAARNSLLPRSKSVSTPQR